MFDQKLTLHAHSHFIKKKIAFIFHALAKITRKISGGYRKNLLVIFVKPHFEVVLLLYFALPYDFEPKQVGKILQ